MKDDEVLALMKDGIKSLPPEAWTAIATEAAKEAINLNPYMGSNVGYHHASEDHFVPKLLAGVRESLFNAEVSSESVRALVAESLTPEAFKEAIAVIASNLLVTMVRESLVREVTNSPPLTALATEVFRSTRRLDLAKVSPDVF